MQQNDDHLRHGAGDNLLPDHGARHETQGVVHQGRGEQQQVNPDHNGDRDLREHHAGHSPWQKGEDEYRLEDRQAKRNHRDGDGDNGWRFLGTL